MRSLFFIVLFMLYFFSAFNRGLYFDKDIYGIHLIIYILFIILIIRLWVQREVSYVLSFVFLIIFPLLYLLSFFYAASPLGSLNLALRWMTYVSFFMLLFWSVYETKWIKKWLPILFQLSGVAIALQMYFNDLIWLKSTSAFILGRFAGVFQYPNTLGMVIGVFIIFSITLLMNRNLTKLEILFFLIPLSLYFYIFIGSFSRGMFIILPLMLLVLLFFQQFQNQIIITTIVFSNLLYSAIMFAFDLKNLWSIVLLIIVSTASYFIYRSITMYVQRFEIDEKPKKWTKITYPTVLIVSGVALILDLLYKGLIYQFLPTSLQETVARINQSSTFRERMLFNEDSFLLGKKAFFFGHGGEGWTALYPTVQQLPYRSKRIHNGIMEVFVDLGIVGLLVYLFSFGLLIYFVYLNWKKGNHKTIHLAVLLSLTMIFLHSLMDFNQAFGTVWFITFILFTISLTSESYWRLTSWKLSEMISEKNRKIILTAFLLPVFIGIFYSFQFLEAEKAHTRSEDSNSYSEHVYHIETAAYKNKYNPIFLYEYGRLLLESKENQSDKVMAISDDLALLEPENANTIEMSAFLAFLAEDDEVALSRYFDGIKLDNFDKKMHQRAFQILMRSKSTENAEQVIQLFNQLQKDYNDFVNNSIGSAHNSREFEITDDIIQHVSTAYYVLEDEQPLIDLIEKVDKHKIKIEIIAKTIILLEENNMSTELADIEGKYKEYLDEISRAKEKWLH